MHNKPTVVITILEYLGRKPQAFGNKPVLAEICWVGHVVLHTLAARFLHLFWKNLVLAAVSDRTHGPDLIRCFPFFCGIRCAL